MLNDKNYLTMLFSQVSFYFIFYIIYLNNLQDSFPHFKMMLIKKYNLCEYVWKCQSCEVSFDKK